MDSHQLIDSLTAHIALYHRSPSPNPNPSPRSSILRWFSSLPVPHRQASLTVLDPDFVRLLLQMQSCLLRHGHGFFFLLADLPSSSSSSLPSLCFRRSRGLLARRSATDGSERFISRSIRLFGSKESGEIADSPLDSLTVAVDFVCDVDRFVGVMDGVSGGRFLRGEENGLGSKWVEMPWLKDMGYYSLEAFVANKLEVALRLAWANSHGGKKQKGGKAKEKAAGVAGVAANAFWRKKGCLDWWMGLDPGWRKNIFLAYLGKAAKSLTNEIIEGPDDSLKNEFGFLNTEAELQLSYGPSTSWQRRKRSFFKRDSDFCLDIIPVLCSGIPHSLANLWNRLLVVEEISAILLASRVDKIENETIFFSTLGSAVTVSDCIMRKLRGLLMVVSIDYINLELMGDERLKTITNKTEEKLNVACGKGKKKCRNSKRLNSLHKKSRVISRLQEASMDGECRTDCIKDISSRACQCEDTLSVADNQKTGTADTCFLQNDLGKEQAMGFVDCKRQFNTKKNGGKGTKNKTSKSRKVTKPELENEKIAVLSVAENSELAKSVVLADTSAIQFMSNNFASRENPSSTLSSCDSCNKSDSVDGTKPTNSAQPDHSLHSIADSYITDSEYCPSSEKSENGVLFRHVSPCPAEDENVPLPQTASSCPSTENTSISSGKQIDSPISCFEAASSCGIMRLSSPTWDLENTAKDNEFEHQNSVHVNVTTSQCVPPRPFCAVVNEKSAALLNDGSECYAYNHTNSIGGVSYEWPNISPLHFTSVNSQHLPAATDRLHLEVGHKWPNNHQSFVPSRHQARNSSIEGGHSRILPSLALPMSYDWPLMVKSCNRLSQTLTVSYDSAFTPALPPTFCSGFAAHASYGNGAASENDRKHSGDVFDVYDFKSASELADDTENYWLSEEESEARAFSGRDYNQFFGGGVMYWNPAEHIGTGFSRPPSHSSEDSSWAWYEADLNRAIDDMVGMPGLTTSYNTNGMASPPAAQFCSPFDPLGSAHQSIGYAIPGNDGGKVLHSSSSALDVPEEKMSRSLSNSPGCVEGVKGDALPYPILRPIIVPSISRKGSRSEFKLSHDHKSPCLPSTRREHPRIKRPPSPVVLCVPRVPRPPPPSPVGESRKRGIPIVRSGSSSPRHWGMRNLYNEDGNSEETHLCLDGAEVVWPSWGNKSLAGTPVARSIHGSLLQDHLITISQLARDQEHPDVAFPLQPPELLNCPHKASLSMVHNVLHEEIDFFCKQVAAENLIRKPYINWAVKRVTRSLQVLWPRSRTNIFGSNATGLALPSSDVDLVVSLPPVRNLEPIKEAGILEGRNGIKETCLQHAARYLGNQEWVRNDSLKTVENTAIPVIMLVAEVPHDINFSNGNSSIVDMPEAQSTEMCGHSGSVTCADHSSSDNTSWPICSKMGKDGVNDVKSIRLDISFKSPSHTGLQTSELVRELTQQFPASIPLALVLKKFLADRSLDHSYSGGLSSYCLVLLITRFLQHEHHVGRPINQNLGSLLMDFLYFFGNIFDPRQMRISIQGSGVYMNRERGHSIDPIHIDDPLFPSNNVGRNCFRIHQCIKAFADAYSELENELSEFSGNCDPSSISSFRLLRKIIPSIDCEE